MSNLEWTGLAIVAVFAYIFVSIFNWWRKDKIKKLDGERERLLEERRKFTFEDDNELKTPKA